MSLMLFGRWVYRLIGLTLAAVLWLWARMLSPWKNDITENSAVHINRGGVADPNTFSRVAMSKGVALVTGAAQGMGRAIAIQLANDGFDVAVNDVPGKLTPLEALVKEIDGLDRKSIPVPGDVSSEVQVKAMIEKVVVELGSLDVVSMLIYVSHMFIHLFSVSDGRERRDLLSNLAADL